MNNKLLYFKVEYDGTNTSKGEAAIAEYLDSTGVRYYREVVFNDLNFVRFDFFVPEHGLAIEFDGRQHFMPVDDFGDTRMKLKQRRMFDKIKNKFIFGNGGVMIRIKYSDDIINILKEKIIKYFGIDCNLLNVK